MKKVLLAILLFNAASAQAIHTGLQFLKLGVGARSTAMGEAFTAVAGDHSGVFYNPALFRSSQSHELMVTRKQWIAETSSEYLGATILGSDFHYAIAALSTSTNNIEVRTKPGPAEGTFNSRNFSLGLSASFSIAENIDAGITGKFLYEKIFIDEASGYGVDFGVLYNIDEQWRAGISVLNFGSMNELRAESSTLPATVRLGTSYGYSLTPEFFAIGAADVIKTIDDDATHIHVGAEVSYNNLLALRAGYQTGYEIKSFTAGFGIRYEILKFDYAFVPVTGAFVNSHTFSLSFIL